MEDDVVNVMQYEEEDDEDLAFSCISRKIESV